MEICSLGTQNHTNLKETNTLHQTAADDAIDDLSVMTTGTPRVSLGSNGCRRNFERQINSSSDLT